jgi:uncharacterized protein (TIGR03085 family)
MTPLWATLWATRSQPCRSHSLDGVTTLAQAERARFADVLESAGPDAPTLCTGWLTRDLAAHVILRERRPDAAPGIAFGPLAGYTRHVQHDLAASPWPQLLQTVRTRSPLLIGPLDDLINTTEFFVHTEDVRRAKPGWEPLPEDARREGVLWRVLRSRGRAFFRRASVGVELELPDGRRHTASNGDPMVTLTGPASELLLYAYGRKEHAQVRVGGDPGAVRAFQGTPLDL